MIDDDNDHMKKILKDGQQTQQHTASNVHSSIAEAKKARKSRAQNLNYLNGLGSEDNGPGHGGPDCKRNYTGNLDIKQVITRK